jgi:hypothetical protein
MSFRAATGEVGDSASGLVCSAGPIAAVCGVGFTDPMRCASRTHMGPKSKGEEVVGRVGGADESADRAWLG